MRYPPWGPDETAAVLSEVARIGIKKTRQKLYPEMNIEAFRSRVKRSTDPAFGGEAVPPPRWEEEEEEVHASHEINEGLRDYTFAGGHFIFVVAGKPVAIPFAQWDAICRDYSAHGGNQTQAEVARHHGLPLPILRRALAAYGHFKASPPNCRERIADNAADFSPLIAEAVENDEARFLSALDRERLDVWKREYTKLKKERLAEDRLIANAAVLLADYPPAPPAYKINVGGSTKKPRDAWAPTADEHVGERIWGKESFGGNQDTNISIDGLRRHAEESADWIASTGPVKVLRRGFLGDLLHAIRLATERGTPMEQDGRGAYVWEKVFDAVCYSIDTLAQVSPLLEVHFALGNHDGFELWQMAFTVRQRYEAAGRTDVKVHTSPSMYTHFRSGKSLHVLDHGYRIPVALGPKVFAGLDVVAREIAGEEFHGCEHIFGWIGDKHQETVASHGSHMKMIRLPAMTDVGDYATELRVSGTPSAYVFRLDEKGRPADSTIIFRESMG